LTKPKGLSLLELTVAFVIGTIILLVSAFTIILAMSAHEESAEAIQRNNEYIAANSYLKEKIRDSFYTKISSEAEGAPADNSLYIYDTEDNPTGIFYNNEDGDELIFESPIGTQVEAFEDVNAAFAAVETTGVDDDEITEVKVTYTQPFTTVEYIASRPQSNTWAGKMEVGNLTIYDFDSYIYQRFTKNSGGGLDGYIIAGQTGGGINHSFFLTKLNHKGIEAWPNAKKFGSDSTQDTARSLQQTFDGDGDSSGYILTGSTTEPGNIDIYIVKTEEDGSLEYDITFGDADTFDEAGSVQQTSDGGYIMSGSYNNYSCLIKLESDGSFDDDINWIYDETDPDSIADGIRKYEDSDRGSRVRQTSDGEDMGYIIAVNIPGGVRLIKIKEDGTLEDDITKWPTNPINHNILENVVSVRSIQQTLDGGYIITGSQDTEGPDYTPFLIKTREDGSLEDPEEWVENPTIFDLPADQDGAGFGQQVLDFEGNPDGYIITGWSLDIAEGFPLAVEAIKAFLIRTNNNGSLDADWPENPKYYTAINWAGAASLQQTFDANGNPTGYIIVGFTSEAETGMYGQDLIYVLKTDNFGNCRQETWPRELTYNAEYPQ